MYTRLFTALFALTILCCGYGCSDSTSGSPQVQIYTEIASSDVRLVKDTRSSSILVGSSNADSLHITRVRLLISRIQMHRQNEDENTGNRNVKTGPLVLSIIAGAAQASLTGDIPEGNYDQIKFELHKLSSSEAEQYRNDPALTDFVTDDRYSVIIDGTVYKNGKGTSFMYKGDPTANLSLSLGGSVNVTSGTVAGVLLRFDAAQALKAGGSPLDPNDPSNRSTIDNAIRAAIRALKK